jgi:hypothetical protein
MTKLKQITKIELIAFNTFVVLALLISSGQAISEHYSIDDHVYFSNFWLSLFFSHMVISVCYILLCLHIQPQMEQENHKPSNAVVLLCVFIHFLFLAEIINVYFSVLLAIKMIAIYFGSAKEGTENRIYKDVIILFAALILAHAGIVFLNASPETKAYFTAVLPTAILHYLLLLYFAIPSSAQKRRSVFRFTGQIIISTAITFAVVSIILALFYPGHDAQRENLRESALLLNLPTQLLAVPLLAWYIFKLRNKKDNEEIKTLKTELGKSDASLTFLKSQINPHFLFNALNTIYGTALQENAERTSEGIQKLGDMMRFMLHENLENKIPLSRDIEYLKNYITIQKLRTGDTQNINIDIQIEEDTRGLYITPMLLIPFIENAFKHGISLQHPSHIRLTLSYIGDKLYLDVINSIHKKSQLDPERTNNGVGLQNVRRRLELIYPARHELIIRENATEFFVHLTVELKDNI